MPCIWPEKPTPASASAGTPDFFSTARMDSAAAFHQSAGFCCVQPGLGVSMGYSTVLAAATRPSSSTRIVLAPEVPMSMPRMYFFTISFLLHRGCVTGFLSAG